MMVGELLNKHEGERVWIFATGPSLNDVIDSEVEGPRIMINRAAFSMPRSNHETYWLVCDDCWGMGTPGPWQTTLDHIACGDADMVGVFRDPLMAGDGLVPAPKRNNVYRFHGDHEMQGEYHPVLAMSREELAASNKLFQYTGTTATAIHLAWLMGADSVKIYGCDGTDGYADRLMKYYINRQRGGCGYMMARESALDAVHALGLEMEGIS